MSYSVQVFSEAIFLNKKMIFLFFVLLKLVMALQQIGRWVLIDETLIGKTNS